MSTTMDFDIGPLTWVKPEIDQALTQAKEKLAAYSPGGEDSAPLKHCYTYLHQASGALQMVGLDGAGRFSDAIEKLVSALEKRQVEATAEHMLLLETAIDTLGKYLNSLADGEPDVPLKLFPEYKKLLEARGVEKVVESELFFPDLTARIPSRPQNLDFNEADLPKLARSQRHRFQQGLLKWLRQDEPEQGLALMRQALSAIERTQNFAVHRSFWWSAIALTDSLTHGGFTIDLYVKQLCARIDQQIRRLAEGSPKVAERLLRDLLYFIAKSEPVSEHVRQVKSAFELEKYLPASTADDDAAYAEAQRMQQPLLRELKDILVSAKEAWLKFTTGNKDSLKVFHSHLGKLKDRATELENAPMDGLLSKVFFASNYMQTHADAFNELVAMEMATALLLTENTLDNYARITEEFVEQAKVQGRRVEASVKGEHIEFDDVPLLDEMSRKAQEKLLIAQVAQEIQSNLRQIEQVMDAFFRDPTKRTELPSISGFIKQILGALRILELERAADLLRHAEAMVQKFSAEDYEVDQTELVLAAEALSALGFYIEAVKNGRDDAFEIIEPMLRRFPGYRARTSELYKEEPVPVIPSATVEGELGDQKRLLSNQFNEWQQAPDTEAREQIRQTLTSLQQDADLMADSSLKEQANEAIQLLNQGEELQSAALSDAIQALTAPAVPTATPSAEVTKLLDASEEAVDADLLETYIEEAQEVLTTIRENLEICRQQQHNKEALVTIRRGFHTLKGSGRMVGLTSLGEVAWGVEQVMNKWLEEERSATPALLDLIDRAQLDFTRWVISLKETGSATVDADELLAMAEHVKSEGTAAKKPVAAAEEVEQAQLLAQDDEADALLLDELSSEEETVALFEDDLDSSDVQSFFTADHTATQETEVDSSADENQTELVSEDEEASPAESSERRGESNAAKLGDDEIIAGGVILNQELYRVFMDEADEHLRTLENEFAALRAHPEGLISHDFMRAAHTLCGTSRTVGFEEPGDLSYALEQWLRKLLEHPKPVNDKELAIIEDSIAALRKMVHAIRNQKIPRPAKQLIRSLKGMLKSLPEQKPEGTDYVDAASSNGVPENSEPSELRVELGAAIQDWSDRVQPGTPWTSIEIQFDESDTDNSSELHDAASEWEELVAGVGPGETQTLESENIDFSDWSSSFNQTQDQASEAPVFTNGAAFDGPSEAIAPESTDDGWAKAPASESEPVSEAVVETTEEKSETSAQTDRRVVRDDIDEQLLAIFMEEAEELFPLMGASLREWKSAPTSPPPESLQRALHTLKGSARMAGAMRLGELTHTLEEKILNSLENPGSQPPAFFEDLEARYDRLSDTLERLKNGLPEMDEPVPQSAPQQTPAKVAAAVQSSAPVPEVASPVKAVLRVGAHTVDRLVNEAGEVSIARSRVEGEMQGFKQSLLELTENVMRLRKQLREIEIQAESQMQSSLSHAHELHAEFDPLEFDRFTRFQELTRIMAESVNDVSTVQQNLLNNLDETEAALLAQARMTKELQQSLMRIRMVPLSSVSERLHRIVRQTAKELGKAAKLEIRGGQVELDRSVLEKITAPFEHLLRNAIAHGLETEETRVAAGKSSLGAISLHARQEGNEIVLVFADDGAGIDLSKIRSKALERGLLETDSEATDAQLTELIFSPGFSTASEVTQVSGRGIGMDVVRNEIAALGGRIEVVSTPGAGTTFTIYLPLTLAVTQAVMVRAGAGLYALPSAMIEQVQEFKPKALAEVYDNKEINWLNNHYPFYYLPRLLGDEEHAPAPQNYSMVMLLRSGAQRAAVHVDELIGNQEIVVKNIGPQLARVSGVAGATVLGNGKVVLIINPVQLAYREASHITIHKSVPVKAEVPLAAPVIMVVDDSLTVRKITGRLLAKEGYQVLTAKDGVDALQVLAEHRPDVMLVDIEMPRMDGFELTKNIRANKETAHIPIIMITSRTAEKHRNYAKELGVNAYLGKPYQEEELLGYIAGFVRKDSTIH